jgi:CheY-like chemotaxis protein
VQHRVLLVEDNAPDAVLAKKAFAAFDRVEMRIAMTAEAAASMLEHELVDLILLDLNLPKISGFELLLKLKSEELTKSIPVVVITSSSSLDDIEKAYRLGAAGYLIKPMSLTAFRDMVAILGAYWFQVSKLPAR